ncbi:MAG: sigma-70 family RNA polymerase sigma factor [Solirubrobacterales bacterium]|nr:sigma-70 family RNA polymerase sigma factor [Solirubrobacterales bacterium]
MSASTRLPQNEDLPAPDFPASADFEPDNMASRTQLRHALDTAMAGLPERYRKVVVLYYTNEMTMKEIGSMLGVNESRISQIHKAALERMATTLGENGITSARAF